MHGFGLYALALAAVQTAGEDPSGEIVVNGSDTFAAFSDAGSVELVVSVAGSDSFGEFSDSGSVLVFNDLEVTRTTSSDTWTSPAFSGETWVECVGGGAGGIAATGGGGGGASAQKTFTFAASTGHARVAGGGGAIGGNPGGNSTFDGTACVAQGGGQNGTAHTPGTAANSTGDTKFDGGAGTTGASTVAGGASAGSTGAATTTTPGTPNGALGRASANASCRPGAGGRSIAGNATAGAPGRVRNTTRIPSAGIVPELVGWSEYRATASTTHNFATAIAAAGGQVGNAIAVGDRVTIYMGINAAPSQTFTDWTQVVSQANGTALTGAVWERVWTGTENTTITLGASQALCAYVVVQRNAQATTGAGTSGTSVSADPPNHTPGAGTYRWFAFAVLPSNNAVTSTPSGYDGLGALAPIATASVQITLLWEIATDSSRDPGTYTTAASEAWVAITTSSSR